ncbi:MAG: galactofuranose ABC transporter, permease protein YjfF, partial [Bdellovibrionota bacterium]
MKKFWNPQNASIFATLFVAIALFLAASLRYKGFFSLPVIVNLVDDNAFLGIAAVGMTFVILSGGIDLSVGSMIGLTSILSAILVERYGMHPAVVAPMMLLLGAGLGAVMGLLIAIFDIAPFLVTLAGMFFLRGMAYSLSQESIALNHPWYQWFLSQNIPLGSTVLPPTGILFLVVVAIGIFVAKWTGLGRAIYAVGGNIQSAKLMGLRVNRTQVLIYLISGMLSALAGVTYTLYTSAGNATAAMGLELDVIAAVVIGGTLLTGGRGSVFGTMVGVFILGTIQTIITFEGTLSSWWTRIVIGLLLFAFVGLQRLLSTLGHRKWQLPKLSLTKKSNLTKATAVGAIVLVAFVTVIPVDAKECPPGQLQGRKLEDGLFQITGTHLVVGQVLHSIDELPDPAPPYVSESGQVEIYGSAPYFIRFKDWNEFSEGGCFEVVALDLRNPNLATFSQKYSHPWDLRKFRLEERNSRPREIIIGGAMSATGGNTAPVWDKDNINRRIYFFHLDDMMRWVRDIMPIVGDVMSGWIGHSYGGNLIQEDMPANVVRPEAKDKPIGFFYERVSDD